MTSFFYFPKILTNFLIKFNNKNMPVSPLVLGKKIALADSLKREQLSACKESAWEKAKYLAHILKTQFKAKRVFVFGSLAEGLFSLHSDLDLMVEGLSKKAYLLAALTLKKEALPFEIDLIRLEDILPKEREKLLLTAKEFL